MNVGPEEGRTVRDWTAPNGPALWNQHWTRQGSVPGLSLRTAKCFALPVVPVIAGFYLPVSGVLGSCSYNCGVVSISRVVSCSPSKAGEWWVPVSRNVYNKFRCSTGGFLLDPLRRRSRFELPLLPIVDDAITSRSSYLGSCVRRAGCTYVQTRGPAKRKPGGSASRPELGGWVGQLAGLGRRDPGWMATGSPTGDRKSCAVAVAPGQQGNPPVSRVACSPLTPLRSGTCLLRHLSGSATVLPGGTGRDAPKSGVGR